MDLERRELILQAADELVAAVLGGPPWHPSAMEGWVCDARRLKDLLLFAVEGFEGVKA